MLGLAPETMLPEKYRRLWRRRLRRRPLLPFLLAATLAVDLAMGMIAWRDSSNRLYEDPISCAVMGAFIAQFGLLGAWVASQLSGILDRAIISLLLLLILVPVFVAGDVNSWSAVGTYAAIAVSSAAILSAPIYVLVSRLQEGIRSKKRRMVTIRMLLTLTTLVALVAVIAPYTATEVVVDTAVMGMAIAEVSVTILIVAISAFTRRTGTAVIIAITLSVFAFVTPSYLNYGAVPDRFTAPAYYLGLLIATGMWVLGTRRNSPPQIRPLRLRAAISAPDPISESIDLSA